MPALAKHQSNEYTKLLIEGDSKSGKTGALASLVKAGYKLRILDMDNGLDVLKEFVLHECPDKIGNVEFRTLRDKRRTTPTGSVIEGTPKAFITAMNMLDRWKYKDEEGNEIDYGVPATWGPDCILVLDTLTFLSDSAFDFREPLTPGFAQGKYDKRMVYYDAQGAIEDVLATLTSVNFKTNVIVISHLKYYDNTDGTKKAYPVTVGSALSPTVPRYFNTVVRFLVDPTGKRVIETVSSPMIDLANPKPFQMKKHYPLETGLADIFAVLRGQPKEEKATQAQAKPAEKPKPKMQIIRR